MPGGMSMEKAERDEEREVARLVERFQAGDTEAFGELYTLFFDRVHSYFRVLLKNRHDAEDATQQTFAQALEALPRYEQRGRPFQAWLFTVARNIALAQIERRSRVELLEPQELNNRIEAMAEAEEEPDLDALGWITDTDLMVFVQRLPLPQRQALFMRFALGMDGEEVAATLDRTPSDVRVLQSRGLRFLRARLIAIGRGPDDAPEPTRRDRAPVQRRFKQAPVLRMRRYALGPGPRG